MIYLIKCGNYLKIGYASDLNRRLDEYKTYSPDVEVIATKDGGIDVETYFHKIFKNKVDHGEWMKYDKNIVQKFKDINIPKYLSEHKESKNRTPCLLFIDEDSLYFKLTGSEIKVLLLCIYFSRSSTEYPGNLVLVNPKVKSKGMELTGLAEGVIRNALCSLTKKGMLIKDKKDRGTYYLNPEYLFKGTINKRNSLINKYIQYLPEEEYNRLEQEVETGINTEYKLIEDLK